MSLLPGRHASSGELLIWNAAFAQGVTAAQLGQIIRNDIPTQIVNLYQEYGGRAPSSAEIASWTTIARSDGIGAVRAGILADPLGQNHSAAVITDLYQTYGGRAPSAGEIASWTQIVRSGQGYDAVRAGILADPLGDSHSFVEIVAQYQNFFGRVPSYGIPQAPDEVATWKAIIRGGADFGVLTQALLADVGSASTTSKVTGSAAAETFVPGMGLDNLVVSNFDPERDTIDLRSFALGAIDPLDAAHAREVHAVGGDIDVLLTLGTHDVLVRNIELAQLQASDFLI